jgi:putative alpha-1,2-mannosidase
LSCSFCQRGIPPIHLCTRHWSNTLARPVADEHNNQPVWHMLWMAAPAGCPAVGQRFLRAATRQFYGPEFYSGDEDNGSMSAWYLLSAMGLYQLVPGSLAYSIGSPMYRHVRLTLDSGNVLEIKAPDNSLSNLYVAKVSWNGRALPSLEIGYDELMQGGVLLFDMAPGPDQAVGQA